MTRPKLALVGSAVMKPEVDADPAMRSQFGWLMKLNISARNCSFCELPTRKFLKSAMSHCCSPGLRRMLRPELPKVPAVGAVNAAGLNTKFWSVPDPFEN